MRSSQPQIRAPSYAPGYTSDRPCWSSIFHRHYFPPSYPQVTHQIVHFGQGDFPLKSEPFCPKKIGPGGRRFSSRKLAPMGLCFRVEDSKAFTTCLSYPAGYTFDLAVRVFAYALTYSASYRHDRLCSLAIFNPIFHPSMIPLSKPYSLTRFFDSFYPSGIASVLFFLCCCAPWTKENRRSLIGVVAQVRQYMFAPCVCHHHGCMRFVCEYESKPIKMCSGG